MDNRTDPITRAQNASYAARLSPTISKSNPVNACPFKTGKVGLIPIRYAIEGGSHKKPILGLTQSGQWRPPFQLRHSHYTLRQLRDGWLYAYSEKNKQLQIYQVKGEDFIEQGGSGEPPLVFHREDTVSLAYSPVPWTPRLREKAEKDPNFRANAMKTFFLPMCIENVQGEGFGMPDELSKIVFDFDENAQKQDIINSVENTCTPFSGESEEDDGLTFVRPKKRGFEVRYRIKLPKPNYDGLYVVLDDIFADLHDLTLNLKSLNLAKLHLQHDAGAKEKEFKYQLGQITSHLTQVYPEQLPSSVRGSRLKEWDFIQSLNQYLSDASIDAAVKATDTYSMMSPQTLAASLKLEHTYHYPVSGRDIELYTQNLQKRSNEVNWVALDSFMRKRCEEIDKYNPAHAFEDLLNACRQTRPEVEELGIDNELKTGQKFLLLFFLPVIRSLVIAGQSKAEKQQLADLFGPNSYHDTAISNIAFANSKAAYEALDQKTSSAYTSTVGNNLNVLNLGAAVQALLGDEDFIEKLNKKLNDEKLDKATKRLIEISTKCLKAAKDCAEENSHEYQLMIGLLSQFQFGTQDISSSLNYLLATHVIAPIKLITNSNYTEEIKTWSERLTHYLTEKQNCLNLLKKQASLVVRERLGEVTNAIEELVAKMPNLIENKALIEYREKSWATYQALKNKMGDTLNTLEDINPYKGWGASNVLGGILVFVNAWNTVVGLTQAGQQWQSATSDTGKVSVLITQVSNFAWTLNAFSALIVPDLNDIKSMKIGNKTVLTASINNLKNDEFYTGNIDHATLIDDYISSSKLAIWTGIIASASQLFSTAYQTFTNTQSNINGYLISEDIALFIQFVSFLGERYLLSTALSFIAPWMEIAMVVSAIIIQYASMAINELTLTPLQSWLLSSTWGNTPSEKWKSNSIGELKSLEKIINKPYMEVSSDSILITFPSYLKNQSEI